MIYGYLLHNTGGTLIDAWFTGEMDIGDDEIPLATSGIAGIHSLYTEITKHPPEYIIGKDLKTSIFTRGELIISIFSSKNDAMAESLARKYLHKIADKFKENGLDTDIFLEDEINEVCGDVFACLRNSIAELNKKAKKTSYIHED